MSVKGKWDVTLILDRGDTFPRLTFNYISNQEKRDVAVAVTMRQLCKEYDFNWHEVRIDDVQVKEIK